MRGGWILDVDVSKFFDTIEHAKIRELIRLRVNDGVITRIIDKWLKAGVWEAGELSRSELGTPQGGVISPLLSNIYLHHVLDKWFYEVVKPRMKGEVFLVRYADDFIMGFKEKQDLERVMDVIPKRFEKFGLTVHPEKTRCIPFQRPKWKADVDKEETRSFDFLGFTHYWGKSRNGFWVVKRKTSKKRLRTKLESIGEWMKENMHKPVSEQQKTLSAKLTGHFQYFGINGNSSSLSQFRHEVVGMWRKWLNRRSRKGKKSWGDFQDLLKSLPLPVPKIAHSDV